MTDRAADQTSSHTRLGVGEYVVTMAWSPQGDALAIAGADGGVYLLDAHSAVRVSRIGEHAGGALSVAFIRDGTHVVSGGQGDELYLHERNTESPSRRLPLPGAWVEHMSLSPDGEWLAVAAGRHVLLYRVDTMSVAHVYAPLPSTVAGLAFSPCGEMLAATSHGGVRLLTPVAPYAERTLAWVGASIALAWRPDASVIATGGQDASVQFWRLPQGEHADMQGYPAKVSALAWDSTGRWLATGAGASVALWDFTSGPEGDLPLMLHGHAGRIAGLRWQRTGPLLASISRDGVLMLWRPDHDDAPEKAYGLAFQPTALSWSPDDRLLAIGGDGGQLAVIDARGIEAQ